MFNINRREWERRASVLITVLVLTFTQVACNGQQEQQPQNNNQPADAEITTAISSDLVTTRGIDPEVISVSTENGIVTLDGTTDNILTKQRAARVAATTKGVRSLVNQITVITEKKDDVLADDVDNALLSDPATDTWEIQSSVENGVVTLTGAVDSWQEKQLAATITKGVDGVKAIENNISVDYSGLRTDEEMENEIESSLAWNTRIDDGLIEVDVENSSVTLSGSVGSLYEKNQAISKAYVAGVTEVVANELEIKSWLREDMKRTDFLADKSDADIRSAINAALDQHPRVDEDMVMVEVENGSVTLTGSLTNLKAARAAAEVVKNTRGVITVDNELSINNEIVIEPAANFTDAEIKEDIQQAFLLDPFLETEELNVEVNNGSVTLTGKADSYFEKYQADEVASTVNGVIQIDNNINVDYEALAYNPSFYDWDVIDDDYDYSPATIKDDDLKAAIKEELLWSPFVSSESVNISVDGDVVTLTGEVLTLNTALQATEEAYEAGASLVNNNLEIL